MDDKRRTRISKFMSLVLRHQSETANLALEPGGWVLIDDLIAGAAGAGCHFTRDELKEVVEACDKQRFAIDPTDTKVRANQGHSAEVELRFDPAEPPADLFHGTPERNLPAVLRGGKPVILVIDAAKMWADGHVFYCSANGVWLVEHVPPQYLRVL